MHFAAEADILSPLPPYPRCARPTGVPQDPALRGDIEDVQTPQKNGRQKAIIVESSPSPLSKHKLAYDPCEETQPWDVSEEAGEQWGCSYSQLGIC